MYRAEMHLLYSITKSVDAIFTFKISALINKFYLSMIVPNNSKRMCCNPHGPTQLDALITLTKGNPLPKQKLNRLTRENETQ